MKKRFGFGLLTSLVMALLLMMGIVFGGSVLADSAAPTAVASDNATATLTIHKDSATGTVVDSTTKLDRNAAYYAELAISYKNGGTQPSASNDVWEYDFPDGITLNATSGSIYDAANAVMGSYSISGSKLTINFDDTWLSTHTSDIETHFTISFKFDSSKTSDQSSVTYNFPAVTDPITVTFDDGNVTGTKSVNSKNGAAVVNDDGSVDYTITLNQDTTVTNFKLIDTLGDNMEYIQDSFQMDGQAITPTFDGQTATIEKATLENSSGHTITYKAKLKSTVAPINGWYDKTTNTAKWTWGTDGTGSAQACAGLYSTMISKTVNGNKTAKTSAWTVTLNSGNVKVDMGGYVFKDTLTSNNQKYTGTATIKDSDGNVIGSVTLNSGDKNFTYTFPDNAGKKQYTITYTTSVDEPGQYGSQTYSNEGTITTKDGSSNWKADKDWTWKGSGIGNADIITKEITNNDSANSGDVSWKVVIKGSAVTDGINNVIFQDDFNDSNEKDHVWFDKTEGIVIKDGDKVLVEGTDYTIAYKDTGSDGKYEQFNVTFKGDYATLTTDLTVTYTSHSDKTPGKYNNWAQISYYANGAKYNNHATLDYTIANTNYVQKTGWASYDSSKSTNIANWTVYGNVKNQSEKTGVIKCNGEDVTLTDVLPSGMTYVEGSAKYQLNLNGTEMALTPAVSTVDGKTTLTFTIPKVNQDAIKVTYQTQVAPSDLTQNGDNTFTNNATMTSGSTVIGSGSATVWVHNNALSKTSEKADNMVKYTITANADAQDLVPDSNELKLEDVLDYQTELVASSVSVKDGSGKSLSSDQYKVSIADTTDASGKATSKLTITVPDGQKLIISYLVTLKGTLGQTINIDNKVNLSGQSTVKTDNNSWYQVLQSSAGGSGATGSIIVTKADKDSVTTTLKGATFDLYRVQNDSSLSEATVAAHSTKVDAETTGDAGTVTFQKDGSTTLLKDQLYYFVETAAPSGYQLDTTPHYFMLGGVDARQTLADLTAKLPNINIGSGTSYTVYDEKAATSLPLGATKTVDGQTPTDAQVFDFSLIQTGTPDGAVNNTIQTVQNNHGTITFSPLTFSKAGTYTYTVQETGNHTGNTGNYVKDATVYTVTVDVATQTDGSLTATAAYTKADGQPANAMAFNNQTDKKTVEISKTDIATGHELAGAVLTIKDASGSTVDSWTSAADKTHSVQLAAGTYTLTETTAPTGYTKAESITFTVDAGGAVSSKIEGAASGSKVTMKDASATTSLTVNKIWAGDAGQTSLRKDVTFQLQKKVGDNGTVQPMTSHSITLTASNAKKDDVNTWTGEFKDLPVYENGQKITYSIVETTDASGNYTSSYSSDADSMTITNTLNTKSVQISKVDAASSNELAGAQLTLTDTSGTTVDSWTSAADKTHSVQLAAGTYTLTETTAPTGYTKAESITFTVGADGAVTSTTEGAASGNKITMKDASEMTNVTVTKKWAGDASQTSLRQDVTFKLQEKVGSTEVKDVANGTVTLTAADVNADDANVWSHTFENLPKYQDGQAITYSVVETSTDANYTASTSSTDPLTVTNTLITNGVAISKVDAATTHEIAGAQLKITTDAEGKNIVKDTQTGEDLNWTSTTTPTVAHVTAGTYYLTETTAPGGYKKAEQISFTVAADGTVASNAWDAVNHKLVMKDAAETTSITATKKWDDGNNAAKLRPAKVTFQLEQTVNNVTQDVEGQSQTVDVTGETQTATFNNLPKFVDGQAITYSVKETGTDPNYAASVSPDGLTITNTLGKHDVQISKVSTGNGQELADAVLTVTNKTTGDTVASWTSDGSTKTISVPAGSYTLTETTAPDGFKKAEAIDFTVGSDGTVTSDALAGGKIVMKDALTTVTIDKQALSNSAELAGAVLKVTDKNGQTVELDGKKLTWTSNGTDKWTITGLKSGDYKLVEETAPNGYAVAESIDFSMDADGNVTSTAMDANGVIIMKDASLSLKVSKITTTGTTELSGAALKIIDVTTTTGDVIKDASNSDLSWTSGSAPQTIDTSNFVIGHVYALVETAAPSGYYTAEQINFRFNEAGQIQVYNKLSREYETIDGDTIVMKDAPIPVTPAPSTTTPTAPTATTPTATPSTTASQPTTVNPTTPYATPSTTTPSTTTATPSTTTVTPNSGTTTSTTAPSTTTGTGTATSAGSGAGTTTGTVSNSTASGNVNTGVHQDSLPIAMAALSGLGAIVILAAYKRRKEN